VRSFAKTSRKMSVLDLQFNSLGFQDGARLFAAFHHNIAELSGLPLGKLLGEDVRSEVLSLPDRALRLAELGIVCGLMTQMKRLVTVDLARNRISAEGLLLLVQALPDVPYVRNLDLSHNPLTNEGQELRGVQALLSLAKRGTQLLRADVEGVLVPGSAEEQALTHSLMANRAVEGHKDGYYINKSLSGACLRPAGT
jgi:Ran GTPase-activating protein (RanGAP) involved in mRNA processing and transport